MNVADLSALPDEVLASRIDWIDKWNASGRVTDSFTFVGRAIERMLDQEKPLRAEQLRRVQGVNGDGI